MEDSTIQHLKHYHEGYRESILTSMFGESYVERIGIDVDRYSPNSARKNSYNEGWESAKNDVNFKITGLDYDIKYKLIFIFPGGDELYEFSSLYDGQILIEFDQDYPVGRCRMKAKTTYRGQNYQSITDLNLLGNVEYKDVAIKKLIIQLTQHIINESNKL
jgi:hypothetical protein